MIHSPVATAQRSYAAVVAHPWNYLRTWGLDEQSVVAVLSHCQNENARPEEGGP